MQWPTDPKFRIGHRWRYEAMQEGITMYIGLGTLVLIILIIIIIVYVL